MRTLLKSEHFFDPCNLGVIIKNPFDFYLNTIGLFEMDMETSTDEGRYELNAATPFIGAFMQMQIYNAPSVAGWKPFYQEPAYNRIWLNSSTLPIRKLVLDTLWTNGLTVQGVKRRLDPFRTLQWVNNPADINAIISDVAAIMFTYELTDGQHDFLKDLVLAGLAESDWTEAFTNYESDPTNELLKEIVEVKLVILFLNMCYLPEYQLS